MRVDFNLYLVTDRRLAPPGGLPERVRSAIAGGVGAVQLREKDLSARERRDLAAQLAPLCRDGGARLLINDRIDVALATGADGVHLPSSSFSVADARRLLGPEKIIGVSTHDPNEAAAAGAAGADYVIFGPVFETPSKQRFGAPLGLEALHRAAELVSVPIFAIGGISTHNARSAVSAGAHGVAVITAILAAADPKTAAASLLTCLARF